MRSVNLNLIAEIGVAFVTKFSEPGAEIRRIISVFDSEAELLGQFGEAGHVIGLFQKLRKLLFKLVIARHEIENALARRRRVS